MRFSNTLIINTHTMKRYVILLLACSITLMYCTNDENEIEFSKNDSQSLTIDGSKSTLKGKELPPTNPLSAKECCVGSSLTRSLVSNDGICCTYEFVFNKNTLTDGVSVCKYTLTRGAEVDGDITETATQIRWESKICRDPNTGACTTSEFKIISDYNQQGFICESITLSSNCGCPTDLDYSFENGVDVGCALAQASYAESGSCDDSYNPYVRTKLDYLCSCPDYVAGVIQGWEGYCEFQSCGCEGTPPNGYCCIDDTWQPCP